MTASPKTELYDFAHDILSFIQEKIAEAQSVVRHNRGAANASLEEALGALPLLKARIGSAGEEHAHLKFAAGVLLPKIDGLHAAQKATIAQFQDMLKDPLQALDGLLVLINRRL